MARVLISAATLRSLTGYRQVLADAGCELVFPTFARQLTEDEILAELKGIDVALAGSEPYTPRVLDANPQLRHIARTGVGYDAVDVAAATARGIPVTVSPANREAVAEHAFALMLALAKGIVPQHQAMQAGAWPRQNMLPLRGRTLGIVGLGRIGKEVALRGQVFGMPLIAAEPVPDHAFNAQHGIALVPLATLFATADIVTLHLPLLPETRGLFDRRLFVVMKPTAHFINTARGAVVNERDLEDVLVNRRIAGAGLDVFEDEPLALDSPLRKLDNVVLSAHTAGVDMRSSDDMSVLAARTIAALLRGDWPADMVVNPEVRTRFSALRAGAEAADADPTQDPPNSALSGNSS